MHHTCTRSPAVICKFVIVLVLLTGTAWAAPLEVSLQDALLGGPLPETQIDAYALKDNGSLAWQARGNTDSRGRLRLELQGLDSGQVFILRARNPFGTGDVYSNKIYVPGDFVFAAGNLKLKFVSGIDGRQPLAAKQVYLRQKQSDGYLKGYRYGTTDAAGEVRFHAAGLDQGVTYVTKAPSPVDGHWKHGVAISKAGTHIIPVGEVLAVKLRDALDQSAGLAGKEIIAYQVLADGKLRWRKRSHTDGQGNLLLDLDGLGRDEIYRLRVRNPFGTGDIYSKEIQTTGDFVFAAGNLRLKLVSGIDGRQPLAAKKIYLQQKQSDGSLKWYRHGTTDAAGEVRFHAAGLDQGVTYVTKAPSPVDGHWKHGVAISKAGTHIIPVGEVLAVKLRDALDQSAGLAGKEIIAYQVLADGKLRWRKRSHTDGQGNLLLDLDGLGRDEIYRLRVRNPFGTGDIYSKEIQTTGDFVFAAGNLRLKLVSGIDGRQPLAAKKIYLRQKQSDGSLKWYRHGTTDAAGGVRFHATGLDQGVTYVTKAPSPVDGHWKYGAAISKTGTHTIPVGEVLAVKLRDALDQSAGLAGKEIIAYQVLADGKLRWRKRSCTDGQGNLLLDLDDLGRDAIYRLRVRNPFGTGDVYSKDIHSAGDFVFGAGNLKLKFVSGIDGRQPLAAKRIYLRQMQSDGSLKWYRYGTTNAAGEVRFHAVGLDQGITYVPRAPSPVDGRWKYSEAITTNGGHTIMVGEVLAVQLCDAINKEVVLAAKQITAYQVLPDGKLRRHKSCYTDAQGKAWLDLDGLGRDIDDRIHYYLRVHSPFGTGDVYSDVINRLNPFVSDEREPFVFAVGNLQINLVNAQNNEPVAQTRVYLKQKLEDGTLKSFRYGTTDAGGEVRFHAQELDNGRDRGIYVAQAKSLIHGHWKFSDECTTSGEHNFVLGEPVKVLLENALLGTGIPENRIDAYELLADGKLKWRRRADTDHEGQALFDLDRIRKGQPYVFRARQPLGTGDVYSPAVSATGFFEFLVGTVSVSLIDADNDLALAGKKVYIYEKLPRGALKWVGYGYTGSEGQAYFHLPGLDEGKVYVFKVHNMFDDGRTCYSPLVTDQGPVAFQVYHEGDCSLDLTPPMVTIVEPGPGQQVSNTGFTVKGTASDEKQLDRIELTVTDPLVGATVIAAAHDATLQIWTALVTPDMVTLNRSVTLRTRAVDRGANESTVSRGVFIVEDTAPPVIEINSHSNDDQVPETGFLVSGDVTDDTGIGTLIATLDDPAKGRSVERRLEVAAGSGSWTLAVQADMITAGETVTIVLTATDTLGFSASATRQLEVVEVDYLARHMINRITFGATPTLLQEVEATGGAMEFLEAQLDPADIDESTLAGMIAGFTPVDEEELKLFALLHMIYSKRQLNEVMTQFWDNHFNTNVLKTGNQVSFELAENQAFRDNALGRFRVLLEISAKSPAMIYYLDNISNRNADANENYARELLELHTMGVDGGYTQADIEAGAEILTGWHEQNGTFFFNADEHNFDSQQFLGEIIPAGGLEQGEALLDIVVAQRSTAEFICTKLSTLFVEDQAPASLVERCADTFQATEADADQMAQVVKMILTSPEFAANYRGKIKTPLELLVGLVRSFEAGGRSDLARYLPPMGMNLFENPVPTGWSEIGPDWINSNLLLERIKFVNAIAFEPMDDDKTHLDPLGYFQAYNYETAEGIVGFLFDLLFDNDVSALDRTTAQEVLNKDGNFDITSPDAEQKLRQLMGTVLSYPQYQMQ